MKTYITLFILLIVPLFCIAQQNSTVKGIIINASNLKPLENVNIVNLSQVKGTITNKKGEFNMGVKVNDTLHLSYLGFKSIKVRVTNDWIKYGDYTTIKLTELAYALEEVVVNSVNLTGYLAVDIKQVSINNNGRYEIPGLPSSGYEAGNKSPGTISKVIGSIFNPVDFLYKTFGKKGNEMRKLKKMKKDDEIRNLLASRFDREMLMILLDVNKIDLDEIISRCNYSQAFIANANDLQVLDAINQCYEEYRVLSNGKK